MALNTSKEVTCGYNNHYHVYMSIKVNKQEAATNKSNVTVKMYAKSDSTTYCYQGSSTVKLTVDGSQKVSETISVDFRNKATVDLAEWTGDIAHDSDGKKTLSCSGSWTATSDWVSGCSISHSIDIDDILRATQPTLSESSIELNESLKITTTAAVSSWTHNLYYSIGTSTTLNTIATGVTASKVWTVPLSIASSIPNATSTSITITCKTYNGSTLIGTKTVPLTVTVPSTVVPTISAVAISEAGDVTIGAYVQGKSKLRIVTTAAGAYGSTIKTYKHTIAGTAYTASDDYTSGVINTSGSVSIVTTVTDSRGRSTSLIQYITVYAYKAPQITRFTCARCDEDGNADNNGTYVKVTAVFTVSDVNSLNDNAYAFEYKESSADAYTALASGNTYSYNASFVASAVFAISDSYNLRLTVTDSFTEAEAVFNLGTSARLLSYIIKKMALAIGKFPELANMLDIALETLFRKTVTLKDILRISRDDEEPRIELSREDVAALAKIYLQNATKGSIAFATSPTGDNTTLVYVAAINEDGILPYTTKAFDLGGNSKYWDNIYGTTIYENGTALSSKYNPAINVTNNNAVIADATVPTGTNTDLGSFTLPAGTWLVIIHVAFASNATGRRAAWLSASSGGASINAMSRDYRAPVSGLATTTSFVTILAPTASTAYYVVAYQNSGSSLTVNTRYTTIKLR